MAQINVEKLEKLSVAEREAIKQQVAAQEEQLKNPEDLQAAGQNGTTEMEADIKQKKALLEKDASLAATSVQKDDIVRCMKQLEDTFVKDMPTRNEMWAKSGTEESDRAVQKNLRFHAKHGKLVLEWQKLAKRLEPDDPWAQSLDSIRPK